MNCHEIESLLDEYVDGESSPDVRRRVERHLAGCADCRAVAERIRFLLDAASKLPRGVPPGRDLFPGIRERIANRGVSGADRRSWRPAHGVRWVGLAASLLIVVIAGSVALRLREKAEPVPPPKPLGEGALLARGATAEPWDAVVREYAEAADQLLAAIEARRGRLSPETLDVLEKNLALIDGAIAEVGRALEADPSSRGAATLFTAMHKQKVDLLRRVARLST